MKVLFSLMASGFLAAPVAHAEAAPLLYRARCIYYASLDDYQKGPTFSKMVELAAGDTVVVGSHRGRAFEVTAMDLTGDSDLRPRRQILLAARGVKDKAILGSATAVFSETLPESISMQTGGGDNFYCVTHL